MKPSSKRHGWDDKLLASRPIGSDALLVSSECDGDNAPKWHAASASLPKAAPGIMTVSIRHALVECKIAHRDRNGLGPDPNRHNALPLAVVVQSMIEPFSSASRRYSDSLRTGWK